jgi:hypothetical protein
MRKAAEQAGIAWLIPSRLIVRRRVVIICKQFCAELMHVEGAGPASG